MNAPTTAAALRIPRLGFLGVGWIGRSRMQALAASGAGSVAAIADPSAEHAAAAHACATDAAVVDSLDALLDRPLDGIVIATPSALHAAQCIAALERGLAVFCQKPLARTAAETRRVLDAARQADRLLGIDMSYRWTAAMQAVRAAVRGGVIGAVHAADLTFHNAYGPDRGWARDPRLAGGGCVIDLGVHLVDLALWTLDFPAVRSVHGQIFAGGTRLEHGTDACEDFATATLELERGTVVRMACSWDASIGRDAIIEARFHGAAGTVAMQNVNGSFHDFTASLYRGAAAQTLCTPPDDWDGRALIAWSRRLADDASYDPAIETAHAVAATLDAVLGR